MIKAEATVCAIISRAATVKEGQGGQSFISFGVSIPITGRDNSKRELEIGVSADGDKNTASIYTRGRRVLLHGSLTVRKKNDVTYFNLRTDRGIELVNSSEPDKIEGSMEFWGKIGPKGIETKQDKQNQKFLVYSGHSSDKDGDNIEFVWVHFLHFHPENTDFLAPKKYVKINGDLQISVYKEKLSIDCLVKEAAPWELQPKQ